MVIENFDPRRSLCPALPGDTFKNPGYTEKRSLKHYSNDDFQTFIHHPAANAKYAFVSDALGLLDRI